MKMDEITLKRIAINKIILNILLVLFYNAFKTLKWKYMLNPTSSEKTSEMLFLL